MEDMNWVDFYKQPFSFDEEFLNDWVEHKLNQVKWTLFNTQDKWIYMTGELGEGSFPKLKENAQEWIRDLCSNSLSSLVDYMVDRLIVEFRLGNIDLDEKSIEQLEAMLPEGEYEKFESECRKRIFKDYADNLGYETAVKLFKDKWTEGEVPW